MVVICMLGCSCESRILLVSQGYKACYVMSCLARSTLECLSSSAAIGRDQQWCESDESPVRQCGMWQSGMGVKAVSVAHLCFFWPASRLCMYCMLGMGVYM